MGATEGRREELWSSVGKYLAAVASLGTGHQTGKVLPYSGCPSLAQDSKYYQLLHSSCLLNQYSEDSPLHIFHLLTLSAGYSDRWVTREIYLTY